MQAAIAALLLAAQLTVAPVFSQFASITTLQQAERPLQVMAIDGSMRTICTVTAIGDGHYWLTAAHCAGQPTVIDGDDTTLVALDEPLDLMILHTDYARAKPLKVRRTAPRLGQEVFMMGHPVGLPSQWFRGYISALSMPLDGQLFTMFDMTACHGNSGSSVVDNNNNIVSVLQIGIGQDYCSGFTGGATWQVLSEFVRTYVR